MDTTGSSLLLIGAAGLAAGFALAVPLGAVGVLVVRRGIVGGWRSAAAGASGVAIVDTAYCVLAVTLGAVAAPVLASWGGWPRIVGGAVLLVIGGWSLLRAVRPGGGRRLAGDTSEAHRPPAAARSDARSHSAGRSLIEFIALTAINPMTLLYFAGVATALGTALGDPLSAVVFVLATGLASLAWQLVLATIGAGLGRGLGARGVRGLSIAGAAMVLCFGAATLVSAGGA